MSRLRRVVGNSVISLAGQAVTWGSTLALTIAYGRFLGDVKFGELYFAITLVTLIGFPLENGFNQQLTRDVSQDSRKAMNRFSNAFVIKGVLWIILYAGLQVAAWALHYDTELRFLIAIAGGTLLFDSIANTFAALHNAFEQVVFPVVGNILEKGLSALAGCILLKLGYGVQVVALVLLGSACATMLWQGFWFLRLRGQRFSLDYGVIRQLLRTSLPFIVYAGLGIIYYRADTVMLSFMTNTATVGVYGAAYRFFETLTFLPNLIIVAIMYPVFSKFSVTSEKKLKMAFEKSTNFLLFCGLPITAMMIVAAPAIIGFLYHRQEFSGAAPTLQALAPGLICLYINTALNAILISLQLEKKTMVMAGIALIFNIGLNLFLIPRYQQVGAALVTSETEFLLLILSICFIPRRLLPLNSLKVGMKALAASVLMAVAILPLRTWNVFLLIPIAGATYLVLSLLFNTIPREDLQSLYMAVRKKANKGQDLTPALEDIAGQADTTTIG